MAKGPKDANNEKTPKQCSRRRSSLKFNGSTSITTVAAILSALIQIDLLQLISDFHPPALTYSFEVVLTRKMKDEHFLATSPKPLTKQAHRRAAFTLLGSH
jgi:hypothetical protein